MTRSEEFEFRRVWLPWFVVLAKTVVVAVLATGCYLLLGVVSPATAELLRWPLRLLSGVYVVVAAARLPRTRFVARVWYQDKTWHAIDTFDLSMRGNGPTRDDAVDEIAHGVAMQAIRGQRRPIP